MRFSIFRFFVFFVAFALLVSFVPRDSAVGQQAQEGHRAVVVNGGTERSISLIDAVTDTALGPFLEGMLGAAGTALFDVVVTPDGNTAIVSNFPDNRLFFIDVGNMPPSLLDSVTLPDFFPLDIALSPDGRFALVTDGGGSTDVVSVDVANRVVVDVLTLRNEGEAQAVAVAPNGETVLVADSAGSQVHVLRLNPNGTLTQPRLRAIMVDGRPNNIAISPDGRTVVVSNTLVPEGNANSDSVTILRIDGPTRVVRTATITGLPVIQGASAFTPDGAKALVVSARTRPNRLSVLDVLGPGMVTDTGQRVDLVSATRFFFFGVDVIAVAPDGTKAYVGNGGGGFVASRVAVVDLTSTPPVLRSTIPTAVPVGIAFPRR